MRCGPRRHVSGLMSASCGTFARLIGMNGVARAIARDEDDRPLMRLASIMSNRRRANRGGHGVMGGTGCVGSSPGELGPDVLRMRDQWLTEPVIRTAGRTRRRCEDLGQRTLPGRREDDTWRCDGSRRGRTTISRISSEPCSRDDGAVQRCARHASIRRGVAKREDLTIR